MNKNPMRNMLLVMVVPLAACTMPGKYSSSGTVLDDCPNGATFVFVRYGDSYLEVDPKANVKRNAAFEFRLKAKKGYENKLVTISGKTANDSWISKSGSESSTDGSMAICVPANQTFGTYYYKVEVDDVGILDPRADVTK